MNAEKFKSFLFWFSLFYLLFWGISFFGKKEVENNTGNAVVLSLVDKNPVIGQLMQVSVKNTLPQNIIWNSVCHKDSKSLKVLGVLGSQRLELEVPPCSEKDLPNFEVLAGQTRLVSFPVLNQSLFSESGEYEIEMQFVRANGEKEVVRSASFELQKPGFFRKLFRSAISEPLFNLLVAFIHYLPNHSLGWAIVLLTLVVRIILFLPNQKAMKSQRKLQKLQPKIEEIRRQHAGNQQMMALQTMELYKTNKINPMSSCWPILLQMPFLIGLYLIVKDGLSPHLSYLLYSFQDYINLSKVSVHFFGMNLEVPNMVVLPFLVGGAQFLAVKISMIQAKKKAENAPQKSQKVAEKSENPLENMAAQMEQMQKMMLYLLPIMIAVFTATLPAAVGVYWLTSTVFGIGQQQLVNWQLDQPKVKRMINNK